MTELAVHSWVEPHDWFDGKHPGVRRTIGVIYDEKPIGPRFPNTEVPVPAEKTTCADSPEEWFPVKQGVSRWVEASCKFCWMLEECREYGLKHPELHGIWGGLNKKQRMEWRKR